MKNLYLIGLLLALLSFTPIACGQSYLEQSSINNHAERFQMSQDISMFPHPGSRQKQFVITLPPQTDEQAFRVGLNVGRMEETDGVNQVGLSGQLNEKILQGWGYNYYEVEGADGPGFTTLVGVLPGTPKVTKFISLGEKLVRYNSRLPIVIYAPENYEVRYRIYSSDPTQSVQSYPNSRNHPMPSADTNAKTEILKFEVGPDRVDCHGTFPQACLIVNGEYFYDDIEGFAHKRGYVYIIEVEKRLRCAPAVFNRCPQDAWIYKYRLKRELSRKRVR